MAFLTWMVVFVLLYMARQPAHQAVKAACRVVSNALRLTARSVLRAEARLSQRNREVLLAAGAEEIEKEVAREFHRVEAMVQRDLQGYPAFHRKMSDLITRIDEDYRQSTEVAPSPPAWTRRWSGGQDSRDRGRHGPRILAEIHRPWAGSTRPPWTSTARRAPSATPC